MDKIWHDVTESQDVPDRRHRAVGQQRGLHRPLRFAQRLGLLRDVRRGRHGLVEPSPVPDERRRQVRRRAGARGLQRLDFRRIAVAATASFTSTRSAATAAIIAFRGSAHPAVRPTSSATFPPWASGFMRKRATRFGPSYTSATRRNCRCHLARSSSKKRRNIRGRATCGSLSSRKNPSLST